MIVPQNKSKIGFTTYCSSGSTGCYAEVRLHDVSQKCQVGSQIINEHGALQSIVSSCVVCHNRRQPKPDLGHLTASRQKD